MPFLASKKIPQLVIDNNNEQAKTAPISKTNQWEVKTLRTVEELRAIRSTWEKLQEQFEYARNPETDLDRYISLIETTPEKVEPYVLLLSQNGTPKAMLIAQKGPRFIKCDLGYKNIIKPLLCCITVTYGGFLGLPCVKACREIIKQLHNALRKGEADAVIFKQLRLDSRIYRVAKYLTPKLCQCPVHKVNLHWRMSVPDNINSFYMKLSSKTRNALKRYVTKLNINHKVTVLSGTNQDELYRVLTDAAKISSLTYQNALDSGLCNNASTMSQLTTAAKHSWLCLHLLYLGDRPSAFQLGFKYKQTYYLQQMGFDPDLSRWRVGTYLFLKVLEQLCQDPLINRLDFGFGDAEYKQRYGDENWKESTFYMFAPRWYPVIVNAGFSLISGVSKGLLVLTRKTGLELLLKRKWRNLLQKK